MEKLRDEFARSSDLAKQKEIAEAVQQRNIEITAMIPVGEYVQPAAMRKNVKGYVFSPIPVFWNVEIAK
jgi:peptide/nickel transport system substrate-binding protein